jgi:hypothetical protein
MHSRRSTTRSKSGQQVGDGSAQQQECFNEAFMKGLTSTDAIIVERGTQ